MRTLIFIVLVFGLAVSLTTDPNDLLSGDGLFSSSSLSSFVTDGSHTTSFVSAASTNVLKLTKPSTSTISYSHGLIRSFSPSMPQHISFEFSSISTETQDANLRLMRSSDNSTVLLFRAGRAGFARVNQNQMVKFYNDSVTIDDTSLKTMKIDLKLNWSTETIEIFVNNAYAGNSKFFTSGVTSVDQILMYNLYPSTSYWKNLVVCSPLCYDFNYGENTKLLFISTLMIILFLFN